MSGRYLLKKINIMMKFISITLLLSCENVRSTYYMYIRIISSNTTLWNKCTQMLSECNQYFISAVQYALNLSLHHTPSYSYFCSIFWSSERKMLSHQNNTKQNDKHIYIIALYKRVDNMYQATYTILEFVFTPNCLQEGS